MAKSKKPIVLVIVGTTASGKSDLAVALAKKHNGEIISADSRQVYRGLDIGTGKITKREMQGIPHYLLDVASPKKVFTVADFKKLAENKIADIVARGKLPIIVGGTGFYIEAITENRILPQVEPDIKLRNQLAKKEAPELFEMLAKLDPRRAEDIKNKNEINNKLRLIRAIEIAKVLGKVPEITEGNPMYQFIKIGILLSDKVLKNRIETRVKKMFRKGLLREIQKLRKSGVSKKRLAEFGFEYNNPTPESVIVDSIKYSKRQWTWFKRDPEINWLPVSKISPFLRKKIPSVKPR
ncbi:MAG: tRNA (adenosine(37)-N6)-dimethylallyltransferase MiaA [Candidatus Pacebacteria bacterium]|nr:tRNA (adenosine(37)-N6)-dimethylallyltransferase MiaA [Candidatus Paceibacterota bacterium]MBP9851301.1 tRNA (adenosine(37)-N6)-dimethylallyltransferase MiaA [Candidatus Paceibacterota bacterium]